MRRVLAGCVPAAVAFAVLGGAAGFGAALPLAPRVAEACPLLPQPTVWDVPADRGRPGPAVRLPWWQAPPPEFGWG
jgi:hypothetical protein